jgi:lysophospholipase L1-like esterase
MNSLKFLCVVAGILFGQCAVASAIAGEAHWVATWSAAPDDTGLPLKNVTLRQIVRTSVGGSKVRLRLSNLYGSGPVSIDAAHLALHAGGAGIQPGSDHVLTFAGASTLTIQPGESVLSDPADITVAPLQELAISLHIRSSGGPATIHGVAMASAYLNGGKDATAAITFKSPKTVTSWYFLTDVEVAGNDASSAIVAFGDSITDGVGSKMDTERRWSGMLASRLQADLVLHSIAVVNAGIAGNRILHGSDDPFRGDSALMRIDRDALDKPGVHWVIVQMGNNDIGADSVLAKSGARASAQQIIEGLKNLIAQAHAKNIKVIGATLPPFMGTDFGTIKHPYATVDGDRKRQEINAWIRSAHAFDSVVDFDQTLRDPDHPDRINPAFDAGDHLHPNDAGHKAMADTFDLGLFSNAAFRPD